MIGRLTGRYEPIEANTALIDVGGVGYVVFASARALSAWDAAGRDGASVTALIETHVREDHIHLYGFIDVAERSWFRLLLAVQGVGAKVALAVLSVLEPDALHRAVAAGDTKAITRADGVGPKLAGRIAAELKDKMPKIPIPVAVRTAGAATVATAMGLVGTAAEVSSALSNLGFPPSQADPLVTRLAAEQPDAGFDALLRAALKELSP